MTCLLTILTCDKPFPKPALSFHRCFKDSSASLQVVGSLFIQTERSLHLDQGSKLTVIVLQKVVAVIALLDESVDATDGNVLYSQVVVSATAYANKFLCLMLMVGCTLSIAEPAVAKVYHVQVLLPHLVWHTRCLLASRLNDKRLKHNVVLLRLRDLEDGHCLALKHWVRNLITVLGFAQFAVEGFPTV